MTVKSTRRASRRASASDRQKTVRKRTAVKANALYEELFASSPDGILLIDAETQRVIEFNDAACRQLGYTREEFVDLRISDYEASETPEETDAHVQGTLREGKAEFDTLHRTKTGGIRHVHVWTKTFDLDGRVVLHVIFRDITERVHTEDERREIGTRLAVVLDNITDGFFTLDGELRYTDINISGATMVGRTPEQLIGRLLLDEFPQAADTPFVRAYRRVSETGEACVVEDYYPPLGRWFEARVYPSPAGVSVFFSDISARKQAEEALRESQAQLQLISENVLDLVAQISLDGTYVYASPSYETVLGYPPQRLTGTSVFAFVHPEDLERVQAVFTEAIQRDTGRVECRYRHADGRYVWVDTLGKVFIDKAGAPAGAVLSTRDITLQKEHEEHITRLNRVYAVLSGINTTIVRTRDRQELFDEACRIAVELGRFRLAWIGLLDANGLDVTPVARAGVDEGYLDNIQLTARDDAPDRCEMVARALREETAVVCNDIDTDPQMARWREEALRRSYRSVVVFPLQFGDKVLGVLLLYAMEKDFFDAEEMKLLAELAGDISFALEHVEADESRHVQSAALNAAADAIVITDRAGIIEWVNPAFTQMSGYTAEEALGKNPRDLVKSGKHPREFYDDLWQTILAGRAWHGEMINRRKDGSLYTEEQAVTPIRDASGAITRFVAIKRDMTEHLQLEAQFRQAQKMESVGQLASGIAHDFNNLLTVINGTAELVLAQVSQDDPVHADVQEISEAGERAAGLTRQLLAFSRQQILEPRVLNLNTVVAGLESLLRRLLGEDIDLVVVPMPGVGHVKADPGQIEQVITNLAVNARDAMPQGGRLTIEIENVDVDEDYARQHGVAAPSGPYVMLSVSDSGVGMDEATRARIFEPFFSTKGPGRGTGLGLSTVYGIVKQSHGFIWVYSEAGRGTTFKMYLPQVTAAASPDRPGPAVVPSVGTETILLVEDNAGLRTLAMRVLKPAGYTVLEAATGEAALMVLERHEAPVHLLLSDVVMPGMSGRELAERLAETRPAMKVLYMSGYTADTMVRHGVLEAKVSFLNKPFTAAALLRKVREVLDS
jgi:PAS domain S-box-containing protein